MTGMSISVLARHGGVGVETIRYYQRRGLLPAPLRPTGPEARAGMRRYGQTDLRRLRFIRSAQAAGFTLEEIRELLDLDATRDRTRVRELAERRLVALDAKVAELQHARDALSRLALSCGLSSAGPCPILDAFDPS